MFVKICGTTNLEDARLSVELGADALGFIFAASKRRVGVEQVAAITAQLPRGVDKVGVFTDAERAEIVPAVAVAGLTAVQLHLQHDPELTAWLRAMLGARVRLLQVVPFYTGAIDDEVVRVSFEEPLMAALRDPCVWAVLLDTAKDGRSGGLGESFSWTAARPAVERARTAAAAARGVGVEALPKLLVAGGLRAENVADAVGVLQPWGVDVVSGVEASPGRKDAARLRAFVEEARKAG